MALDSVPLVLVSASFGLGAALLAYSLLLEQRRRTTARRVATFAAPEVQAQATGFDWKLAARKRLERALGWTRAHAGLTRAILIMLTLGFVFAGMSTESFGLLALAACPAALIFFVSARSRRQQQVAAQVPSAMEMLAAGLRAGYSVFQAIELLARESPEPTASEFAQAARELALGEDLETTFKRLAARTNNPDYELVSIVVAVQHEIGGNLAVILDSVANTIRERMEIRTQVAAITAQQRLSSIVLTLLPVAVLIFLTVVNREFVLPLFVETAGRIILAGVAVLLLLGWSVMRSMTRIEV